MRFTSSRTKISRGNALAGALCITSVIGIALLSYLTLSTSQNQLIVRSQTWNTAMTIAEAGVEEALTHCSRNYITNMTSCGWALVGSVYTKQNQVGAGNYAVTISTTLPYTITCTGNYPMPGSSAVMSRSIKVTTVNKGAFAGSLIVRSSVDLKGNDILTDSFDSTDTNKSSSGRYDSAKARDKGDVTCAAGVTNTGSVKIGNANIWGHVFTGPGSTLTIGSNGKVGDVAWQNSSTNGVEPGWWSDDFNLGFPPALAPVAGGVLPLGDKFTGQFFASGVYELATLGGKVIVTGNAVVNVTDSINFTGSDFIDIQPGASLTVIMSGATALFGTIINPNANAISFQYYGQASNTSVDIKGNATVTAAIYATEALITLHGGVELFGGIVGKSVAITGSSKIHYDESLMNMGPSRGYIVASWNEL